MNAFVVLVALVALCETVNAGDSHFIDCHGNSHSVADTRCCTSNELPNNCECFTVASSSVYTNSQNMQPQCPSTIHPSFKLFTKDHKNGVSIKAGESNVKHSPLHGSKKTHFIAHGFTDSGSSSWMINLKNALLNKGDFNVILVDWKNGAKAPNYYQAAANTRTVGAMVGRLIEDLHKYKGVSYNNIHLIGHSLGAHAMGCAGKEVKRLTGSNVGHITGLDPAGPAFEKYSTYVRLDKSDANFVDVIHTDGEDLLSSGFGTRYSIGHADFYVNGGRHQPGCPEETYGILSMLHYENEKSIGACSHSRAHDLYIYSISKCTWNSPKGGHVCTLGYKVGTSCRGDHYPKTGSHQPYC